MVHFRKWFVDWSTKKFTVWLVLGFFLLFRLAAFTLWPGWSAVVGFSGDSDGPNYHAIATQLALYDRFANGDGTLTLVRPPAFPYWLAILYSFFGTNATWAGFLGQQIWLTVIAGVIWLLGRELFGPIVALAALLLVSVDPVLGYLGWTYLTEPMHIAFLLLGLYFFVHSIRSPIRSDIALAAAAGLAWGIATLTRLYFEIFPLFFLPLSVFYGRRVLFLAAISSIVMMGCVVPWLVRNEMVVGERVPLTLNSGISLWGGNNPYAIGDWVEGDVRPELYRDAPRTSEMVRDDWFRAKALEWIKTNPYRFIQLSFLKAYRLFHFYNFTTRLSLRWVFLLGGVFPYLVSLPSALYALAQRKNWSTVWPIVAVALPTVTSAMIFYGDVRLRTPIEPLILLLAVVGFVQMTRIDGGSFIRKQI